MQFVAYSTHTHSTLLLTADRSSQTAYKKEVNTNYLLRVSFTLHAKVKAGVGHGDELRTLLV